MLKRTDYAEKRHFGRRPTNARGWIKIWGRPLVPCIVTDLSYGGAAIECDEDVWVPTSFHLICESLSVDKYCEVRHHNGKRMGVEFMAETARPVNSSLDGQEAQWAAPVRTFQPLHFRR